MILNENANKFLYPHIQNVNMKKHCLGSQSVWLALALKLNPAYNKMFNYRIDESNTGNIYIVTYTIWKCNVGASLRGRPVSLRGRAVP